MSIMPIIDLWKNDIIDQILLYSKFQKKQYYNFKFNFQIASFSIITSAKLYSDRIDDLSVSTEDFLSHMRNEKYKIIDKKINHKNPVFYKNFNLCHRFGKFVFSYNTNNIIFKLQMFKNFNFYKKNYLLKNFFSKKQTKFSQKSLNLYISSCCFLKNTINNLFIPTYNVNFQKKKLLGKNLSYLLNIENKISKVLCYQNVNNSGYRSYMRFKKNQKFLIIKKKMKTYKMVEDYFIFLRNKFLPRPISMVSKKNKIIFKKIGYFNNPNSTKKYRSVFFSTDSIRYNNEPLALVGLSINFDYELEKQIILEKKRKPDYTFIFFLKSPFLYNYKSLEVIGKINSYSKINNLCKFKKYLSNKFEKVFLLLMKKNTKTAFGNLIKYGSYLIPKKLIKFIKILKSKSFFLKTVIGVTKNLFLIRNNCFFLMTEFFFKNNINIKLKIMPYIKKKIFNFLKYIIFYQSTDWCQPLLNGSMNNIFFICHEIGSHANFF